jgi:hypothetical protein
MGENREVSPYTSSMGAAMSAARPSKRNFEEGGHTGETWFPPCDRAEGEGVCDGGGRAQGCCVTFYRSAIAVFAVVFIGIGLALLVVTAVRGGAAFGYLMGVLFVALGVGRLYLLRTRR